MYNKKACVGNMDGSTECKPHFEVLEEFLNLVSNFGYCHQEPLLLTWNSFNLNMDM